MFCRNEDFELKLAAQSNYYVIHRRRVLHGDCGYISTVDAVPNYTPISSKHFRRNGGSDLSLIADANRRRATSKFRASSFG